MKKKRHQRHKRVMQDKNCLGLHISLEKPIWIWISQYVWCLIKHQHHLKEELITKSAQGNWLEGLATRGLQPCNKVSTVIAKSNCSSHTWPWTKKSKQLFALPTKTRSQEHVNGLSPLLMNMFQLSYSMHHWLVLHPTISWKFWAIK